MNSAALSPAAYRPGPFSLEKNSWHIKCVWGSEKYKYRSIESDGELISAYISIEEEGKELFIIITVVTYV